MYISRLILKNWRNFRFVDQALGSRVFLVGPTASGKTNFLDAISFLRDLAAPGFGGLQKAISIRDGVSKIRCLSARQEPTIELDIRFSHDDSEEEAWRYSLAIDHDPKFNNQCMVIHERAWKNGEILLDRPDEGDDQDPIRLHHTHLEQVNANRSFREIAQYLSAIRYANPLPMMMRDPKAHPGIHSERTNWGQGFFDRLLMTQERTRRARLKKIEDALKLANPRLKRLTDTRDDQGTPHLEAMYDHWRPNAGKQNETQFSDGTLRLIFMLWSVQECPAALLLEEPEQSLHASLVRRLHQLLDRVQGKPKTQLFLSTHSSDLVAEPPAQEVLLFIPESEGTRVAAASTHRGISTLLQRGYETHRDPDILPIVVNRDQLDLFEG